MESEEEQASFSSFETHNREIRCFKFSVNELIGFLLTTIFTLQDSNLITVGCDESSLKLWDLTRAKFIHSLSGHAMSITCCDIQGDMAITGSM
jgi:WD40 repeat protein